MSLWATPASLSACLQGATERWDALGEALLHYAARRDHLVTTVRPALQAGTWVISDRFADSTMAYQGFGLGLGAELIEALEKVRASSCDGLHSTVLLARQRFIDVAGELNAEYDLRTDHGGREGVQWPPDPS